MKEYYNIIVGDVSLFYDDFCRKVDKVLASGWRLQGGVSLYEDSNHKLYMYQAIVKKEKEKEEKNLSPRELLKMV